jgi:hypothetical protein
MDVKDELGTDRVEVRGITERVSDEAVSVEWH